MRQEFTLRVNDQIHRVEVEGDTPLLYVLRNDLGLKGVKHGCGSEQCGACKVLIDGQAVPSCKLPVKNVQWGSHITTIEGLGTVHVTCTLFKKHSSKNRLSSAVTAHRA